ncbi:hypothetical protein SAMN05216351_105115 [Pseudobutyrivibrio sp. JW11]|uniref:hypothetical protein n=1 Tax=Pseudobutyrivibrio sp. JW11 TaxID=1855302 RepID=UPI0008E5D886|nr:hypothetical protein [Pseudobutyrivibrio sp. JW11]SFO26796.1 hypothetical protein SAMN05216351_105115 [Pseudobutyrivibrio sp. JW11]
MDKIKYYLGELRDKAISFFAVLVGLLLALVAIIGGFACLSDGSMETKEAVIVIILGLLILVGISIYTYFKFLKPWRCPVCGKFFAIKGNGIVELEADEFLVDETSYSVNTSKVETGLGTFKVETPESHTEQVKYTRRNYQKNYICKYCGEEFYKTFSGDRMRG